MCGEMPCLCVDVDFMYYADLGEPCAINKTGLQCAHWRNNLSDTMEKEGEREGMEQTETSPEREERKTSEERMKNKKKEGAGLRTEQEREKLKGANPQGL